jgi:hypothetical protein
VTSTYRPDLLKERENKYASINDPELKALHGRLTAHYMTHTSQNWNNGLADWTSTAMALNLHMLNKHYPEAIGGGGNHVLRTHQQLGTPLEHRAAMMNHIMASSPGTPEELHLYRGISGEGVRPFVKSAVHGAKIHVPHPMATSINPQTALWFADQGGDWETNRLHLIHFKVPKGLPSVYIGNHGAYDQEREMILPHGKIWEHKGVDVRHVTDKMHPNGFEVHIHHMIPTAS